jgi:Icc-related predicted phosphoesterase
MRCLVVADLHYSLPQFDWLVSAAPHFDLVVIAGDALDIGSIVDFRAQIVVVKKYLELLAEKTHVILCSGNHDLDERDEAGEKISRWISALGDLHVAHDGESLTVGDNVFTICPWWDGPRVKDNIGKQLEDASHASRKNRWIWVHHAPALNSPTSWGGKRSFGDAELVQWISAYQPDMVLSGHVHQSPFISDGSWYDRLGKTWVFNVGQQAGRPPTHIMLDLDQNKAYWFSAYGEQFIDLDQPLHRPAQDITSVPDWLIAVSRATAPVAGPSPEMVPIPSG